MTDRNRLLIITHRVIRGDGQGRVNLEIANACLTRGWQVTLAASDVDSDLLKAGAAWLPLPRKRRLPDLLHLRRFSAAADRVLRSRRGAGEVTIANGFVTTERHSINCSHFVHAAWQRHLHSARAGNGLSAMLKGRYQTLHCRANIAWERNAYAAADRIVAVSEKVRDELMRQCRIDGAKVTVIPNGIDLSEYHAQPIDRQILGMSPAMPTCLFIGDLRTDRKNLSSVLRAVATIPGVQLAVAGDARRSPFPELAKQLGCADRVRFLGFRQDIPQLLRAADVLVAPSYYEPFGLVIIEALASGIPVVTSANSGASEAVREDVGTVIASPSDCEAIRAAIIKWTTPNCVERSKLRALARAAAEPYSWSNQIGRYMALLEGAALC